MEDWKDALAALRSAGDLPDGPERACQKEAPNAPKMPKMQFFYEKKGRAGKPATIIAGFDDMTDDQVADISRFLKQRLGCGGSSRGGEILLQGDRRQQAKALLNEYFKK
ncbi:MAG: translation initiation factor [Muribaculaceae bacterium]|nr:translation initiation factor [Muribaculaceae bacterium]